jgi:hypothetical protein
MTFEEQILHVQDITPMIRKTRINSMNLDIFTEEDFLPSPTSEVFGLISHNFPDLLVFSVMHFPGAVSSRNCSLSKNNVPSFN